MLLYRRRLRREVRGVGDGLGWRFGGSDLSGLSINLSTKLKSGARTGDVEVRFCRKEAVWFCDKGRG